MPTTTNFGWTTPADTDLVKDGAAAIRTLAGNIDTSLVDLKGGTTGQFLSKNSNTDLDFVFATPASGGMTLISTTTLTGASVTLSSIPTTYKDLKLIIRNYRPVTDAAGLQFRFNADSTANRHGSAAWSVNTTPRTFGSTEFLLINDTDNTTSQSLCVVDIPDYANTSTWKMAIANSFTTSAVTTTEYNISKLIGYYNQTSALTSIQLFPDNGDLNAGTALLYGVS